MQDYKTIKNEVINQIEIDKSKFICYLKPVENELEVKEYLKKIKKLHNKADHYCYVYIIDNGNVYKANDDGEPSGTAGSPMLDVLRKNEYNNIIAVVVRYFGGVLLGKGGLVKAYSTSIIEALNQAEIMLVGYRMSYKLIIDYSLYNSLSHFLAIPEIKIINKEFIDIVELTILVISEYDINKIFEFLNGKIKIIELGLIKYEHKKTSP